MVAVRHLGFDQSGFQQFISLHGSTMPQHVKPQGNRAKYGRVIDNLALFWPIFQRAISKLYSLKGWTKLQQICSGLRLSLMHPTYTYILLFEMRERKVGSKSDAKFCTFRLLQKLGEGWAKYVSGSIE